MKRKFILRFCCVIFVFMLSMGLNFTFFVGKTLTAYACAAQQNVAAGSMFYDDFSYKTSATPADCKDEKLEFYLGSKVFEYHLKPNIKKSDVFTFQHEINKYNRFSNSATRIELLKKMLRAGFDEKVALNYLFPNLDVVVKRMEKNINYPPRNAAMKKDAGTAKVFYIMPEKAGLKLDTDKLYIQIANAYLNGNDMKFNLPTITMQPQIFASSFESYTHLRGDFSTNISSSSADRKHNIKNALASLNWVEVLPNEVFSFNKVVGRRTEANGYRPAKIIVNNEFVEGFGGGVCQVSTTLYNSALLAGLEIVEANRHSKQIGYVKYGFDAMVNFGSSDLKFRNTTGQKIVIVTNFNLKNIRIRIFGEDLKDISYKLVNEIVSTTEPNEEQIVDTKHEYVAKVFYEDESFMLKKGSRGMEVKSYRQMFENGVLIKTELLRFDKFKPQNAVRVFGTEKRPMVA